MRIELNVVPSLRTLCCGVGIASFMIGAAPTPRALAQPGNAGSSGNSGSSLPWREGAVQGQGVSREVREIYEKGLDWLMANQSEDGSWQSSNNPGAGVTGLCVMTFLAYGEDPNHGLHSIPIRRGLQSIVSLQDPKTGYLGGSMYHHGFATLALAEAYGAIDEKTLWQDSKVPESKRRSLGEALELAVRTAITSQEKNSAGGWRYAPTSSDADTSVSGAVLMSLLAARNAGIEVPDKNVDRAIKYFTSMTSSSGQVAYAGGLGGYDESQARVAIATLVYSIAGRKDLKEFKACSNFLKAKDNFRANDHYGEYTSYYKAQALFQADTEAWEKWNKMLIKELKGGQKGDGRFDGSYGPSVATSLSLLSLALNFRFLPIYER